jgi:hypothetical protein
VRWSNTSAEKTEGASASVSTSAFTSVYLLELTLATAFVHLHKADVPVRFVNVSTALSFMSMI